MFNLIAQTAHSQLQQGTEQTWAKNVKWGTFVLGMCIFREFANIIFSFQRVASVLHGHGTQTLYYGRPAKKEVLPRFSTVSSCKQQGLVNVSTPDHSGCKFVHLGPPGILWESSVLRLFSHPGPKGLTRKHALPRHVGGRQSCNLSK